MLNREEMEQMLEKNLEEMTLDDIAALEVDDCASCGIEVENEKGNS